MNRPTTVRILLGVLIVLGPAGAAQAVDTTPPNPPGLPTEGNAADLDLDDNGSYTVYWPAATDAESAVQAYEVQERIGAAGAWTTLTSTRTSANFAVTGRLDKTQYFYQVRARNAVNLWSDWSPVSDGILVDKTGPASVVVTDDGAVNASLTQLHATWTASTDAESGVVDYQYIIRRGSTGGTIIVNYTSVGGPVTEVTRSGLSLAEGQLYYIGVRAKNGVGLYSSVKYANGIRAPDSTPPSAPGLPTEGSGADLDYDDNGSYTVYWPAATDAQSGIGFYEVQESTSAAGPWTTLTSTRTAANFAVTSRLDKKRYFYQVRAQNKVGGWGPWSTVSDGILIDKTNPTAPATVTDDGATTFSTTTLHATWTASSDPDSGVVDYQYIIRQGSTGGTILVNYTSVGPVLEFTRTDLNLTVGTTYFIGVRAKNGAGRLGSVRYANGILVQASPDPIAEITSPGPDNVMIARDFSGPASILGTADHAALVDYRLEVSSDSQPEYWNHIAYGTSPIRNGVLGTWYPGGMYGSVFTLRLTVRGGTVEPFREAIDTVVVRVLSIDGLFVDRGAISPNGDGRGDQITLSARANYSVDWTVEIRTETGTLIRTHTSSGTEVDFPWDGTDASGTMMPEGNYEVVIRGRHPETGVEGATYPVMIPIDLTPPEALITSPTEMLQFLTEDPIPIAINAQDALQFESILEYGAGTNPASFTLLNREWSFSREGGFGTLTAKGLAPGVYTVRLSVEDVAGNRTVVDRHIVLDFIGFEPMSVAPLFIDPHVGEQATLQYTLNHAADVTVRIYDELTKSLVRTFSLPGQAAGAHTVVWDGRTDAGELAPLDVYFLTIDASDGAGRLGRYNDATAPRPGADSRMDTLNFYPLGIDPYRNDVVTLEYGLTAPGRFTLAIRDVTMTTVIRSLLEKVPQPAGTYTFYWDGRRDDGTLHHGPYSVAFGHILGITSSIVFPLPEHGIVLQHPLPEVTAFRTEAYLIHPAFREVSTVYYTLSRAANVTVAITDPNGNAVRTLLSGANQGAGEHTLQWDGRKADGRMVSIEGDYRVRVTLVDPITGVSSHRDGCIVVYK